MDIHRTVAGDIRIGSAGWYYDHWREVFYPAGLRPADRLGYYVRHFNAVEINNSFYKLPEVSTLEAWRAATPAGFCFAVKASRYLTHMKKLRDPDAALANFLPRIEVLGSRLGPILFQLPPHWRANPERLELFLRALPARHRYAFEFRDPSWHTDAIYALLERHRAAFCIFDLAGFQSDTVVTTDLVYVRLHGPQGRYGGSYSRAALRTWARRIERWSRTAAVHFYFDNDIAGHAPRNALTLKSLL
jgi:uncharacterized protein YecE (DUF72 family)